MTDSVLLLVLLLLSINAKLEPPIIHSHLGFCGGDDHVNYNFLYPVDWMVVLAWLISFSVSHSSSDSIRSRLQFSLCYLPFVLLHVSGPGICKHSGGSRDSMYI